MNVWWIEIARWIREEENRQFLAQCIGMALIVLFGLSLLFH